MTIITLILLGGGLPIRVSAELPAAEGILRSEHQQRSYELRWEQQLNLQYDFCSRLRIDQRTANHLPAPDTPGRCTLLDPLINPLNL